MHKVIARTCTKCGRIKLLDNFCNSKDGRFNKKSQCKLCDKKYKEVCQNKSKVVTKEKICTKCGILKPASDYNKSSKAYDGLTARCKLCNRKDQKKYADSHKEQKATYNKKHSKKQIEYNHMYYKTNKERLLQQQHEYYESHKELKGIVSRKLSYTKDELINELHRAFNDLGKIPTLNDMTPQNGYLSSAWYYKYFGSFTKALEIAGFDVKPYSYSKEFLLNELHRYVEIYGKIPNIYDMKLASEFPGVTAYVRIFGSWNNALIAAGYTPNLIHRKHDGTEECVICGTSETVLWHHDEDGNFVCNKCHCNERQYFHGNLDPNSRLGAGVISEHVISLVLNCTNCNSEYFNSEYDLMSEKYGTINAKSSRLKIHGDTNSYNWNFRILSNAKIPDHYICVGFNEDRSEIMRVWIVPNNADIVAKCSITVTNSPRGLKRASQYEVDPTPYDEVYQSLDITTLPEFRNIKQNDTTISLPTKEVVINEIHKKTFVI